MSGDSPAEVNDAKFAKLQERHSRAAEDRKFVPVFLSIEAFLQVSESQIKAAISSFPTGYAGGLDGLLSQHMSNPLNCLEVGPALLTEIMYIVYLLLRSNCTPASISIYLVKL